MATPSAAQLLEHAILFTATERLTLPIWNSLLDSRLSGPADVLLNAGLLLEHYQSLLDNDPGARTAEQLATLQRLEQEFSAQIEIAKEIITNTTPTPAVTAQGFTQSEYARIRAFFGFDPPTIGGK